MTSSDSQPPVGLSVAVLLVSLTLIVVVGMLVFSSDTVRQSIDDAPSTSSASRYSRIFGGERPQRATLRFYDEANREIARHEIMLPINSDPDRRLWQAVLVDHGTSSSQTGDRLRFASGSPTGVSHFEVATLAQQRTPTPSQPYLVVHGQHVAVNEDAL